MGADRIPRLSGSARQITTDDGQVGTVDAQGRLVIPTNDGGVIYRPRWREKKAKGSAKHADNLAETISDAKLAELADELLREIQADDLSRREYLDSLAKAIEMLGIRLEDPRSADNDSSAPLEGMSTFRHPLLLQAAIRFQADFVAELLPTDGPVKVRDDSPEPPTGTPGMDNSPALPGITSNDLSMALEKDLNHYLTQTAAEYYPDTTRMAFRIGLMGPGFKKVYHCPLRKRPVSESIDVEDLIVNYAATDLRNAERVTHRIKMQHSKLRRMVKAGVYRDVTLGTTRLDQDPVEQAMDRATGVNPISALPSDHPHIIYECCTERDIEGDDFLPYKITLDKEARNVLAIYRNWDVDDERKLRRQEIVDYGYLNALGFYALGLVHVLGNTVRALTAAFREFLDAGMFGNFPGFLYADDAGKQNTNQFRVAPGSGAPIKTGGKPIGEVISPMPYKSPDAAFMQFIQHMEESGKALGGEAAMPLNEGVANMPVGTMLAGIEQALKPIKGVFKGLHRSQAEEFQLLKQRFREDPGALWRFNQPDHKPAHQWEEDEFLEALGMCSLVPMADPNTASQVQRIAIAWAMLELAKTAPYLFHERDTALRFMRMIGIPDPEGILASAQEIQAAKAAMSPPPPAPGKQDDPNLTAAKTKQALASAEFNEAQASKIISETQSQGQETAAKLQENQLETQLRGQEVLVDSQDRAQDRASKLAIAQMKERGAALKTGADLVHKGIEGMAGEKQTAQQQAHEAGMGAMKTTHESTEGQANREHQQGVASMKAAQPQQGGQEP